MERIMLRRARWSALMMSLAAASLSGCGGGGSAATNTTPPQQSVNMQLLVSDATSDDWATIGVQLLSVALIPQGGGDNVTIWTAGSPAPTLNLVQLDSLADVIGSVSTPVGTYTGAVITVAGNPGDIALTVSSNPESGFPATAGTTIPSAQIAIQGTQGSAGSLTVPITLNFDGPLVVSSSGPNVLNVEFDLAHPAFIVAHNPPAAAGTTIWAVNFKGPVRRRHVGDLRWLVLRHSYGTVQTVGGSSFTMARDFPVVPASNPEGEVTSPIQLTINLDTTNGTILYDADNQDARTVVNSSFPSALAGKFVRVAARYQEDGTLTAVRVWYSSTFANVWLSPEGHVLSVDDANGILTVENEDGVPIPITIGPNTLFYFRAPQTPAADTASIGQGPAFLASGSVVRGFKVHVSPVDVLASPLVADTVDIERANYSGTISNAATTGFTYTRSFLRASDDYTVNLDYIPANAANMDPSGDAIMGFDWWYFTFPTQADTGANAVADFVSASNGSVNFGGTYGAVAAWGASSALWSTAAAGWQVPMAILEPTPLPIAQVVDGITGSSFSMAIPGNTGGNAVTVDFDATAGSATLVYQVNRSGGVVTVTPLDLSNAGDFATFTNSLVTGSLVKLWSVPQPAGTAASGALKAYVIIYYTGTLPQS
ncbi:MAG TPA: DUF4382 domain-containing protein [Steroidobacteraceae bacterium]|nr:DUF4382 domain-containing protein [Steroidobacteraceae bacterium]